MIYRNGPVCDYCGLHTHPLAYHEGARDCQEAAKAFAAALRSALPAVNADLVQEPNTVPKNGGEQCRVRHPALR